MLFINSTSILEQINRKLSNLTIPFSETHPRPEIPAVVNVIQLYGIGVMKDAKNPKGAAAFEEFLLSNAGQKILNDHGYTQIS